MISIGNLQINKLCLGDVSVSKAYLGDVKVYDSTPIVQEKYLTMTVLDGNEGTTIAPTITGTLSTNPNLQYRVNNGSWNDFIVGTTAAITAQTGDTVQWKGTNESGISTSERNYLNFSISGNPVALSGNVMSLIDGVGDSTVIPNNYCFYKLFSTSNVKNVSQDFLPATTLTNFCYADLFSESLLENSPELPALTMKENCYRGMFYGCIALTNAPALPATKLNKFCYQGMFQKCTSLVNPPELPANSLQSNCYYLMFSGCTALTTAPELPATTLSIICYKEMFSGCKSLTTAPELPATTLASSCYIGMFAGCTSLATAPELPATTLASSCYQNMFNGCTSLTTAPELPATTLVNYCYQGMFRRCSKLNYVKCLATDITANRALDNWLLNVSQTGTFVKKYGVEYLTNSPSGIPQGWTVEDIDAPTPPTPEGKYMTMTVLDGDAGTTIAPTVKGSITPNLQYRINNGSWNDFVFGTTAAITAQPRDVVNWKGVNESGISNSSSNYMNFSISGNPVALSGNVMSLIDGVGDALEIPCNYCFCRLFQSSSIKTVSQDFLPATTLKNDCYYLMFYECTSLVTTPELPATTLASNCYNSMFQGCTSLVNAPKILPATTLSDACYGGMFRGCTSLTTATALPATKLAGNCYSNMFHGCSKLVNAPALPATKLDYRCYNSMFNMCTSLKTAPELPATTLEGSCYQSMFSGCMKLNYVKSLATNITASNALKNWMSNVSSSGTFVKPAGVSYETGDSGIPSGWTIQNI